MTVTDIVKKRQIENHDADAEAEGLMLHERVASGDLSDLSTEQKDLVLRCIELRDRIGGKFESEKKFKFNLCGMEIKGVIDAYFRGCGNDGCAIIDWKFGRVPVPAPAINIQIFTYAIAAMMASKKNKCCAYVFQPRISKEPIYYEFTNLASLRDNLFYMIDKYTKDILSPRGKYKKRLYGFKVETQNGKLLCENKIADLSDDIILNISDNVPAAHFPPGMEFLYEDRMATDKCFNRLFPRCDDVEVYKKYLDIVVPLIQFLGYEFRVADSTDQEKYDSILRAILAMQIDKDTRSRMFMAMLKKRPVLGDIVVSQLPLQHRRERRIFKEAFQPCY